MCLCLCVCVCGLQYTFLLTKQLDEQRQSFSRGLSQVEEKCRENVGLSLCLSLSVCLCVCVCVCVLVCGLIACVCFFPFRSQVQAAAQQRAKMVAR
jgi:hypothetical protein